jgi:hypothetical protein
MVAPTDPPSNRRVILYLVLLAAFLPEMITGSTPPEGWLNPIQALLNLWLYGAGVLAVREIAIRWKLGYPGILTLGAAYGILEEGLAVTTFFNPFLPQVGVLAFYGRLAGVNWVWAVWLSTFHAMFSIAIPIFLIEWHWPKLRGHSLLSDRLLGLDLVLLGLSAVTINALVHAFSPYQEDPLVYVGALAAIGLLAYAANHWADRVWCWIPPRGRAFSRRTYAVAGFLFLLLSFLIYAGGPSLGGLPALSIVDGLGLAGIAVLMMRRTAEHPDGELLQFAFVAGAIGMFCAFDWFLVIAGHVTMVVPSFLFAYLVVRLYRERSAVGAPTGASLQA